jgi:hypothetical protein
LLDKAAGHVGGVLVLGQRAEWIERLVLRGDGPEGGTGAGAGGGGEMTATERAALLIQTIRTLLACDNAIAEYEAAGISGTLHDLEHREMRAKAAKTFEELDKLFRDDVPA